MSASSTGPLPSFGVFGCLGWSSSGTIDRPATISTTGTLQTALSVISPIHAAAPVRWDTGTNLRINSATDSTIRMSAELMGSEDPRTPTDTPYFVNNIAIVTGGNSGGGGSVSIYDEGGLVRANTQEIDVIGAEVAATISAQGSNRVALTVTSEGSTGYPFPDILDESDPVYFYFGWDFTGSDWAIQRQERSTSQTTIAVFSANTTHATLDSAWEDRIVLTYT